MLDTPHRDRKAERHEETRAEIVAEAWRLAGRDGIGEISLREIARRVGMRAPSLYTYFDSKQAIYDAMFADGWRKARQRFEHLQTTGDPRRDLRAAARMLIEFSLEDPVRYQLMQQRPVPGFEPSDEAYGESLAVYEELRERMAAAGITAQEHLDLWTAILSGLAAQQIANDPGGDRWLRLVDDAVDMYLTQVGVRSGGRRRKR